MVRYKKDHKSQQENVVPSCGQSWSCMPEVPLISVKSTKHYCYQTLLSQIQTSLYTIHVIRTWAWSDSVSDSKPWVQNMVVLLGAVPDTALDSV